MDPVTQALAQQQSGSAEGQGFGQFYVEGQRLGQEQQNINLSKQRIGLEERRVRMEEELQPFRKQLLSNQAAQLGQELVITTEKATSITKFNDSLPQFFELQREMMDSPLGAADPRVQDKLLALSQKYGKAAIMPGGPGHEMWLQVDAVPMFQQRLKRAREAQVALKDTGTYLSEFDEKGQMRFGERKDQDAEDFNQMLSLFRAANEMHRLDSSDRRLTQGDDRLDLNALSQGVKMEVGDTGQGDGSANMFSQMMDFLKAKRAARTPDSASPPPDQATGLPSDLPSPLATPDALSPSIVTPAPPQAVPALTRKRATFTPVERPLQAGEASKLQAQHVEAQQGLFQISQLENQIRQHPEAFGPLSEFRSWAEVVRGLTDDNADATVNAVKEQAGTTFVSLARTLRPDSGNMSHFELMELKKIGDLRRVQNVPSVALAKADIIKAMIVAKDLRLLQTLKPDDTKRKVDDFLLTQIRSVDLHGIIQSGLLKKPDADRWHELYQKRLK